MKVLRHQFQNHVKHYEKLGFIRVQATALAWLDIFESDKTRTLKFEVHCGTCNIHGETDIKDAREFIVNHKEHYSYCTKSKTQNQVLKDAEFEFIALACNEKLNRNVLEAELYLAYKCGDKSIILDGALTKLGKPLEIVVTKDMFMFEVIKPIEKDE